MHSLEPEFASLRAYGVLDPSLAERAIAVERGSVFSIHDELRAATYAAVALISVGVGMLIKHNYARIGPLAILVAIGLAAAACYATAVRSRRRGTPRSVVGEYLLLLGGLLLGAGAGFGELQFHWLGADWARHLLLLAVVHVTAAYYFESPLLLTLGLTAFAAWFGVEPRLGSAVNASGLALRYGWRALACAGALVAARWAILAWRRRPDYRQVFDHFALNLAFGGALSWCTEPAYRLLALVLLVALTVTAIHRGRRTHSEFMLVYGVGYAAMGLTLLAHAWLQGALVTAVSGLLVVTAAAVALWRLRAAMRHGI